MGMLDQFTPQQKQLALAGVPVVAVFAFVASRKKTPPATEQATGMTTPIGLGSGVLGVDQLAAYESSVTDVLSQLSQSIYDLENRPVGSSQVPPAQQQPAPVQQPVTHRPPASVDQLAAVYGRIPAGAGYGYSDFPTTNVATSVQAPAGGSFMYGQWNGDQLVSATYQLPDGSFAHVGG